MSRKKFVVGNWKMHGSLQQNDVLLEQVLSGSDVLACDVGVCVPFPYLGQVAQKVRGTTLRFGAQTLSEYAQGAYTGEVSASMLSDLGCQLVLVGHSERRTLFGETDAVVAAKFRVALAAGLCPILCVGETLVEREAQQTEQVVRRQLEAVLDCVGLADWRDALVAYEPVWAIGTGVTASPEQAQRVHRYIRDVLAQSDALKSLQLRILYGGSVKPENACELFAQPDIDGGLIGGASLVAEDFLAICQAVA